MILVRLVARFVLFAVVILGVCWGTAWLIEWYSPLDMLIDRQILQETSLPLAMIKAGIPAMIVAAVTIGLYRLIGYFLHIR